ncbi:uncharacterized protein Z520_05366 [Fonsecaea multimorphosa CBS 102226]|uniref:Uncharacterized protein n=1 Tax=Fonsecaea multimorphosa CBS 102226 TaxID=1442371 RepID=A0A0D2HAM1_9EURO|nr:uncharacterized protein Z520_05366 [Fonsecaea multimorphosa CBS 102226]KIX98905.1 hypothetical protein Z520_05366 [Fonsecaea multimorphosa CBS 102226]OAL25181.1 hypothetical protein AYO22_05058 [Fonsecaea multimorphosa]
MSDRRRRSHDEYTREPIFIERSPQVRTYRIVRTTSPEKRERLTLGSKLYNLFRTRKKRVQIIEEVPVRSRRPERRSWSPPPRRPPPPSPPRGPYHTMSSNMVDDIYTPLPPKLPPKTNKHHHNHHEDDPIKYVVEKRSPRSHKVKIIHEHVDDDDPDAHPKVESPSSPPRKRDSGKYYMTGARMDDDHHDGARREYERVRPDPEVQRLRDDLEREERKRRQAELSAAAAKEKADRYKADLEYEKRKRSLEKRERDLDERETRLNQEEREHFVEARRPRDRQGGVVVHNPPAAVVAAREPNNRSALDRARDDYDHLRSQQARDERRPATGDRRSRRQSIIIVDDEHDRDRDRRQQRR